MVINCYPKSILFKYSFLSFYFLCLYTMEVLFISKFLASYIVILKTLTITFLLLFSCIIYSYGPKISIIFQ